MGTRSWIGSWPVYRQLTGTDRRGLGAADPISAAGLGERSAGDNDGMNWCPLLLCDTVIFKWCSLLRANGPV